MESTQPTVEQVVSSNVRRVRTKVRRWSSTELAARLESRKPSGAAWDRSRVTRAENGERAWRVEDLVLFASTLDVTVDELLRPEGADGYVTAAGVDIDLHNVVERSTGARTGLTLTDLDKIDTQIDAAHAAVVEARSKLIGDSR